MTTLKEFEGKAEALSKWLVDRGAEIMSTTNPYEVLRFRTSKGTSVFYTKKGGEITFTGEAETVWLAFREARSWRAMPAAKRKQKNEIRTIRDRDGDLCFYCQEHVSHEDESAEHLISITHGGIDHISNKFLAHKVCNLRVGNLSATQKIKIHVMAVIRKIADKMKENYANN